MTCISCDHASHSSRSTSSGENDGDADGAGGGDASSGSSSAPGLLPSKELPNLGSSMDWKHISSTLMAAPTDAGPGAAERALEAATVATRLVRHWAERAAVSQPAAQASLLLECSVDGRIDQAPEGALVAAVMYCAIHLPPGPARTQCRFVVRQGQ